MASHSRSERFPKRLRLTRQREFDRVFQSRISARDTLLIVHCAPNFLEHSRLGISASRRLGNAVARNYWKRLIREAFRRQQTELPQGLDLVVRPQGGPQPEAQQIAHSLLKLAGKLQRRVSGR